MARTAIGGISLHPMLNDLPAALLPTSALCDLMALATGRNSWASCAYHTLQIGTITGMGAAAVGLMDYQDVPPNPEARAAGRTHLVLNAGALAMSVLNLMLRDSRHPRGGFLGTMLSVMTLGALSYSAIQGARLAYQYGMALPAGRPPQPVRQVEERAAEVGERAQQAAQRATRSVRR